jgi:citrate lyase synthetase
MPLEPMSKKGYFYVVQNKNRAEFKASRIRELIANKKFRELRNLVPQSTLNVVKGMS